MKKKYSEKFKTAVINAVEKGTHIGKFEQKLNLFSGAIRKWKREKKLKKTKENQDG